MRILSEKGVNDVNDNYLALSNAEKERFAKTLNYLLNKTYVLREIYEIHDRIGKFNPDYRFIERNLSLFEFYLDVAGYEIKKDDTLGIIELRSRFEYNLLRLDKFSTLMLVCLRQIYDEEIEKSPTKKVVVLTSSQLVLRMIDNNLVLKKPTIKEGATTLKLFMKHNIITKFSGDVDESNFTFLIYPTILKVVSNEKLTAIYNLMLKNQEESEGDAG
jgi:hypothetical protein